MKVSVIIAAFNVERVLDRALRSVLAQSWPAHEIIIVDDCSTDGTTAVAQRFAAEHQTVTLLRLPANGGPAAARNAGMVAATGDWLAVLDADDAWRSDRLQVLGQLATASEADLVMDNQRFYDAVAGREASIAFSVPWHHKALTTLELFENDVADRAGFPYSNFKPIFARRFLEAHRLRYDVKHRYGEDFLLLAECLLSGAKAMMSAEPMYIYTTRLGEFSKAVSPYSQSTPRFDLLLTQSDDLESRYGAAIDQAVSKALRHRRSTLNRVHLANVAREFRRKKRYGSYLAFVLRNPDLIRLLLHRTFRRALSKLGPSRA